MKYKAKGKKHDLVREICEQLEIKEINEKWFSAGSSVTADAFKEILYKIAEKTGVPPKNLPETDQLIWRLLHKSHEAMLQALQTINNPTLIYRLESFLFLFINSWELLLKSKVLKDTENIANVLYADYKSISLSKALDIIFTNENGPIKQNLLAIEELRNQAMHLIIPIIPTVAVRLFQAGIFNYSKLLNEWFDRKIDEHLVGSMMFLISSIDPNSISIDKALLSKKITKDVAKVLKNWEQNVIDKFNRIPENEQIINFAIPIDINISIIKNPNKADILSSLSSEQNEDYLIALKYQRPIDKYPYSFNELYSEIKKSKPDVKKNKLFVLMKEYDIRNNPEFATPNFIKKQTEEKYKETGILPKNITFIYNKKALEFLMTKI